MGPSLLVLVVLATPLVPQSPDTTTYSSAAARELIARAAVRHRAQDSSVADYRARLRYRLSVSLGRRRWSEAPPFAAEEQEATMAWSLPNDLRVDIVGRRFKTGGSGATFFSAFDSPWFVPRGLSDSVRVFGTDFPERAALHPLAADGADWYRYLLGDTVVIGTVEGRRIRLAQIDVIPKRAGPALVVGKLWLEMGSGEVVRFAFRYVGTELWQTPLDGTTKDSAAARRGNQRVNRILSIDADLEYALQEGKYWMPYRQVLSGQVQIPLVGDVYLPFEAVTTFDDYEINRGEAVAFRLPRPEPPPKQTRADRERLQDSLRVERRGRVVRDSTQPREVAGLLPMGGRFEIRRAPRDSLRRYVGWGDSLRLRVTAEDQRRLRETKYQLAGMAEQLSRNITGRSASGFGYERLADAFRFNRVQGSSLGLGYRVDLEALRYTALFGTVRYGLSDQRLTGRLSLVRDAPSGKLTVSGYHDLGEGDPFSRGLSAANSIRALVSARDEGEYFGATGGSLSWETSVFRGVELTVGLRGERQRSVAGVASAWLNDLFGGDGQLLPNPPIRAGNYLGVLIRLAGQTGRARWQLTAEGQGSEGRDGSVGRIYGEWRQSIGGRTGVLVRSRAGLSTAPVLPQWAFRAGGQGSVRGFDYGVQRGQSVWAVQADLTPFRRWVTPVVFVDAGQAGPLAGLGKLPVLLGGGFGLAFLNGLVRLDLSRPISPKPTGSGVRVDVVLGR